MIFDTMIKIKIENVKTRKNIDIKIDAIRFE